MPYRQHRELYTNWAEDILQYVPDFAYVYHDLRQAGADELQLIRAGYLRSMFLLMKISRNKDLFISDIGTIFGAIANEDGNFARINRGSILFIR
jgi:hypothetical protein